MTAARTILLADDSVTIRKVVELTFSDTNIRVLAVASGHEALERMSEVHPDLVLADVVMPGPSGYDVCRAVKGSPRPVPVLLLTGAFEPFDPAEAEACGSDGTVTKPFDSRSLVERVEELLARGARPASRTAQAPAEPPPKDDDLEEIFDALADAAPEPKTAPPEPPPRPTHLLSESDIDAIARAVVVRLSDKVLREIAWDVVPDLAEVIVRERLQEIERGEREPR
ncbi:MAG TPA: response regulator [Candidatus Polarisedimenticolaceae bacterium]|nr:response regulator [Candidatus Polarisedimenticolaceae bacterium]